jgi:MFS family permease
MLAAVITSFVSGQLISHTGRYRWNVVLGPAALTLGMVLLWRMDVETTNGEAARDMVVAGIGIGSMMQVFVLSVQNAVERRRIGAATALTQFARQMGATVGVALIGVIVNRGLPASAQEESAQIHRLPPDLRDALASALRPAFLAAAILSAVVWLIAVLWVKEVPLRRSVDELAAAEAAAGAPNPGEALGQSRT